MKTNMKAFFFIAASTMIGSAFVACHKKNKESLDTCTPVASNEIAPEGANYTWVGYWVQEKEYTENCTEQSIPFTADTIHIIMDLNSGDLYTEKDGVYYPTNYTAGWLNIGYNTGTVSYDIWSKVESTITLSCDGHLLQYVKH